MMKLFSERMWTSYMTRFGHAALAMRDGMDQHGVPLPELDKLMFEFSNSYKMCRRFRPEFEKLENAVPFRCNLK